MVIGSKFYILNAVRISSDGASRVVGKAEVIASHDNGRGRHCAAVYIAVYERQGPGKGYDSKRTPKWRFEARTREIGPGFDEGQLGSRS